MRAGIKIQSNLILIETVSKASIDAASCIRYKQLL